MSNGLEKKQGKQAACRGDRRLRKNRGGPTVITKLKSTPNSGGQARGRGRSAPLWSEKMSREDFRGEGTGGGEKWVVTDRTDGTN